MIYHYKYQPPKVILTKSLWYLGLPGTLLETCDFHLPWPKGRTHLHILERVQELLKIFTNRRCTQVHFHQVQQFLNRMVRSGNHSYNWSFRHEKKSSRKNTVSQQRERVHLKSVKNAFALELVSVWMAVSGSFSHVSYLQQCSEGRVWKSNTSGFTFFKKYVHWLLGILSLMW